MSDDRRQALADFVNYARSLQGDEKGEAQPFLDLLFKAFGHAGASEAGAVPEARVRTSKGTVKFADLLWAPRVLIEMKKRGTNLALHEDQIRGYWHDFYPKTRYVVLCNFDEFWVYDFFNQSDPVDKVALPDLPKRYLSLAFLLVEETKPQFGNDRVAVSRRAADLMAALFNALMARGIQRERAQRFVLQCVFCLFAEDFALLPKGLFTELIGEATAGSNTFDLFGQLFKQMNTPEGEKGGRFKSIEYFNGGLFGMIDPIELGRAEVALLADAAKEDWSKVQPPIFGALFEGSMGKTERHAYGAHFTSEADIMKVVRPTIIRPWTERIEAAKTLKDLQALRDELLDFRVLDPACGCGNFLYVAYREMRKLETTILLRIFEESSRKTRKRMTFDPKLSLYQFHGIDINSFAVELTKVTLMLGKEQSIEETRATLEAEDSEIDMFEKPLPLENLDKNIVRADALFAPWPRVHVIIGNPPFLGGVTLSTHRGEVYAWQVRHAFPEVSGAADYCTYWFSRAHAHLPENGRAGLVATNTISQKYSRAGSLDKIVSTGGVLTEAVSSQEWSGEAAVYVAIVNWKKGKVSGKKSLYVPENSSQPGSVLIEHSLDVIPTTLQPGPDVSKARRIGANDPERVSVGQMAKHKGFIIDAATARTIIRQDRLSRSVLHPFLTGEEMLTRVAGSPFRYIIDISADNLTEAMKWKSAFEHLKISVLPGRKSLAKAEVAARKSSEYHQTQLQSWWRLARPYTSMIK